MAPGRYPRAAVARQDAASSRDKAVTELLDHIAGELAAEYVRLMDAAAQADRKPLPATPPDQKGD